MSWQLGRYLAAWEGDEVSKSQAHRELLANLATDIRRLCKVIRGLSSEYNTAVNRGEAHKNLAEWPTNFEDLASGKIHELVMGKNASSPAAATEGMAGPPMKKGRVGES